VSKPAYPGRDTPPSYVGEETPAECPECGHKAYIAAPESFGREGHCTSCNQLVQWEEW
jgi:hypothetical protein